MVKPYIVKDKYFFKAKQDGFRARSVYKLDEIQSRYGIIRAGDKVLDLGAAPGSFLQEIAMLIGSHGSAIGIDLQAINPLPFNNVAVIQADILDKVKMDEFLENKLFDCITADLAPKTSGIKDLDSSKSLELNEAVLEIAKKYLKRGGNLVSKIFEGDRDFQIFYHKFKNSFQKASCYKPKACRERSRERFLVGVEFRGFPVS